jgi:hypothetical protein
VKQFGSLAYFIAKVSQADFPNVFFSVQGFEIYWCRYKSFGDLAIMFVKIIPYWLPAVGGEGSCDS